MEEVSCTVCGKSHNRMFFLKSNLICLQCLESLSKEDIADSLGITSRLAGYYREILNLAPDVQKVLSDNPLLKYSIICRFFQLMPKEKQSQFLLFIGTNNFAGLTNKKLWQLKNEWERRSKSEAFKRAYELKGLPIGTIVTICFDESICTECMIIGKNPICKENKTGDPLICKYIGVPYPEGYVDGDAFEFIYFSHADIAYIAYKQ